MDDEKKLFYIKVIIVTLVVIVSMYFVYIIVDSALVVFAINIFILFGQFVMLDCLANEYLNKCKEKE